jgi:outer membrane biosynthesis protein TonB
MPAAVGPRFVLEAGFLVLLAVVVGFAELSPALIILVMALGWLLVSLIEYFAWRQTVHAMTARYDEPAPAPVVEEQVVEDVPPPPPPAPAPVPAPPPSPPPAAEEETVVQAPEQEEKETVAEADERFAAARASFTAEEKRLRHRLDPLQPRPRRRWVLFGPYERRPEPPAEGDREEES